VRKARRFLTVLAAPLLCTMMIMLGAPAMAAPLSMPPGNGTFFQLESQAGNSLCMQESGTTSTVFLGTCSPTNKADLWYAPTNDISEIANLRTGLCLSVTGYAAGTYLHTCAPGQTAQEWNAYGISEIRNTHTGYCLWQSTTVIQQRNSCNPNNVHDLWLLL
jgi:Ricin-type beta-trefoil lectin domain